CHGAASRGRIKSGELGPHSRCSSRRPSAHGVTLRNTGGAPELELQRLWRAAPNNVTPNSGSGEFMFARSTKYGDLDRRPWVRDHRDPAVRGRTAPTRGREGCRGRAPSFGTRDVRLDAHGCTRSARDTQSTLAWQMLLLAAAPRQQKHDRSSNLPRRTDCRMRRECTEADLIAGRKLTKRRQL